MSCARCSAPRIAFTCGAHCGTQYCSEECGVQDWKQHGHEAVCAQLIGASGKRPVSRKKAREILHHGEVHGHPLTEQQRKFFGYWSNQ